MAKPRFVRPTPRKAEGGSPEKQPCEASDELRSPWAVLGLFALLVQPILLWVRFWELSNCLAMTSLSDHPLGFFPGTSIPVTSRHAMGIGITLVQMLSASVAITDTAATSLRARSLRGLAVAVLVVASLLDLGLAVATAPDVFQRSIAFTLALLLAVAEPLTGILAIDCLIVPLYLTVFGKLRPQPRQPQQGAGSSGRAQTTGRRPDAAAAPTARHSTTRGSTAHGRPYPRGGAQGVR